MGLFDGLANSITREIKNQVRYETNREIRNQTRKVINQVKNEAHNTMTGANKTWTVVFDTVPTTLDEMLKLPESSLNTPEGTAALLILVLCNMPNNKDNAYQMVEYLCGPRGLSNMDRQFINDRFLEGHNYIPRSYFEGSTPSNNYTPNFPYTIKLYNSTVNSDNNMKTLLVQSSGADSKRDIQLRFKPSTNQWFIWEYHILSDIRKAAVDDPWA